MEQPGQHRSIQDIIPPARSRPIRPTPPPVGVPPNPPPPPTPPQPLDMRPNKPKGTTAAVMIGGIVLVIAILIVAVMTFFFHRATVTVTPHRFTAPVDGTFETSTNNPLLPHTKVSAEDTKTKSVAATGSKHVENRASGTVTVHNAYSTKPQRLITNTRFETKDGKIYRVHTPIVVPGYTMKAGVKVPGTLDVTLYADEPGDKYNIGLEDFSIPGLKNSKEQYQLMYAKSKTAMSGGFVGEQAVVESGLRAQTVDELKAEIGRSLQDQLTSLAPPGSLIFADTITITYAEGTDTADGANAIISVSGSAFAPAFSQSTFAAALATSAGINAPGPLAVENPSGLSVRVTTPDSVGTEAPSTLTASGQVTLVGSVDTEALARDLSGKSRSAVGGLLAGYPSIADLVVKIYPFWLSSVPTDAKDVHIEITPAP